MPRARAEFLILALDIGSSSMRCALFDQRGVPIPRSTARADYSIHYTAEGGAELSPMRLYRASLRCVRETLRSRRNSARLRDVPIAAIGGCSFWHSLLGLNRTGDPVTPIYTWADMRSAPDAAQLREELAEREIQLRTGCVLRAAYWPAKLRWLRRTQPALVKRVRMWVSPAQWLFRQLFGADPTSHSMASGTGLYALEGGGWDAQLCATCGVDVEQLGSLTSASEAGSPVRELEGVPVFGAIGDGAAGNLGCGADSPEHIAINVGTSAAVRRVEPRRDAARELPAGLFRYVVDDERFVLGGATSNAGNLRQWCAREFALLDVQIDRALMREDAAVDGATVLPFLVAERAPTWPENTGSVFAGVTQTSTTAEILRAAITSTYYRLANILDEVEKPNAGARRFIVSGGVTRSPASLAILADALGRDIMVSAEAEASLRGGAIYTLRQLGFAPKSIASGKTVRHHAALAEQHRVRRNRHNALEQLLASA